jgi:hypothetical protein
LLQILSFYQIKYIFITKIHDVENLQTLLITFAKSFNRSKSKGYVRNQF